MTVAELIQHLQLLSPDAKVKVPDLHDFDRVMYVEVARVEVARVEVDTIDDETTVYLEG